MCGRLRALIEPAVFSAEIASTLYDTGLLMVVKGRYNASCNSSFINTSVNGDDLQQKAISNFYMIYDIIFGLSPTLTAFYLARLGDKGYRKLPICCPLLGYVISRAMLLLVVLLGWPLQVMFGAVALQGLSGGFSSYWAGVMAIASDQSSERQRSVQLVRVEVVYGVAGFIGSMASGYVFSIDASSEHQGIILAALSVCLFSLSLIYSLLILKIPSSEFTPEANIQPGISSVNCDIKDFGSPKNENPLESSGQSNDGDRELYQTSATSAVGSTGGPGSFNMTNIVLLFIAAVLYDIANGQSKNILISFVVKKPLNWDAKQVGYGNAADFVIYLTSFLGVWGFSRCLRDISMIMIGVFSLSSGLVVMTFVKKTYMFFIARALNLFALMTMPTIRSMLSKQVDASSYGKIFVLLELSFTLASVITSPIFTKIYQATLDWFAGFCFILSSILSFLAIIPVGVVAYRTRQQQGYEPIPSS
ncbi:thymic stromal cotransporter homolog isoform X1 [Erpetoichthys calabaricus]|uniref:Solute carrier family 46 member 2 n=1 Tax=Erpetoichthys calabaricus TaxID=27687 RepID=A0A8C4S1A1_ERPCA|nr:thymic stromal cotransporter homolog isoform X1 [Erpetoichthys calabaricus]